MKILFALLIIFFAVPAQACVLLEHGNPKVGSEVSNVTKVELEFSGKIYPEKSTVVVTDQDGKQVSTGKAYGKSGDENFIATNVTPLAPGKYKVTWGVFCDCGMLNPGDYKFTVK